MEENEIWRDIIGYEGLYQVSNFGRVKRMPRFLVRNGKNGKRPYVVNGQILKHNISSNEYHLVGLRRDGERKRFLVHRLVYEAFIGKIPSGMQINHINEDKSDNRLSNLNLMTPKENSNWGTRNERVRKKLRGMEKSYKRKRVLMDNEKEFESITKAAKYLGCTMENVSACCRNITQTAFGHKFRYK